LALTRWFAAAFLAIAVQLSTPASNASAAPDLLSPNLPALDVPALDVPAVDVPAVDSPAPDSAALNLPDSPTPNLQATQDTQTSTSGEAGSSSSSSTSAGTSDDERQKLSQEQMEEQLHQRVFAVMATFNTTTNKDALPLSTRQKYVLFFRSATDPWPFALNAFFAGIDQAENSFPEYGQGVKGYAKRFGAAYTDYFTGNLLGNAVLASLLKEDPRYFQKGSGRLVTRALWAASSSVWCRRDNGSWGPNYANVFGNLLGSSVSNLYYPESDRTVGGTIGRGFTVTAQAIIGSEIIEFWPDIVRNHQRKQADKLAKEMGRNLDGSRIAPAGSVQPQP
jgi:hypothetical protein